MRATAACVELSKYVGFEGRFVRALGESSVEQRRWLKE